MSVIINESIVAILGAIMPEPLAIPKIDMKFLSNLNFLNLIFG